MIRTKTRPIVFATALGVLAVAGCDTKANKGATAPKLNGSPAEVKTGELGAPSGGLQSPPTPGK